MNNMTSPTTPLHNVDISLAIAEGSSVLLWISDTQKQCIYFNKAWLDFRGRSQEQEYGYGWAEGVHPDDLERCVNIYNTAFDAREKFSMDYRLMKADGNWGWIQDDGVPFYDSCGVFQGYVGSCFDITETKNLLDELQVQKTELETANLRMKESVKAGHVGVWDWDISKSELVWDERMYEIYGLPPTEGVEKLNLWKDALHSEDKEITISTLERAVAGECEYDIEFRIIHPNGETRHIKGDATVIRDDKGNALRMLGTNLDITERRLQEEKILKLERRNQALLDYSPVCHKIVDLDFKLRYMNLNGFKMFSLPVNDEWYGKPYPFSFFSDKSKQAMTQKLALVKQSKQRQAFELIAHDNNGTEVWLFHTIIPVFKADCDELDYITVVSADITEQKRVQEELRHREKMDAIGQLAGGVAHDFNNQLASILGYAEILKFKLQDEESKKYLSKIIASAERSGNLTKQMLAFSRKQNLQTEITDIHTEIADTIDLLQHSLDKRIAINTNFNACHSRVEGDRSRLESALLNLAINAADAMEDGGNLDFITTNVNSVTDNYLRNTPDANGDQYICIEVKDTGMGIDEATINKIFDPFFTTKLPGKGTGMGLASVYGTLKQHNGFIRVNSQPGRGTSFFLYLPVISYKATSANEITTNTTHHHNSQKKTILVVDDEDSVRELCCDILQMSGFEVLKAHNGKAAVELFETQWQEIDAVILDLVMPVMSGSDALIEIKRINPEARVLVSSGYNSGQSLSDIKTNSHTAMIEKPFKMQTLLSELDELLYA